MFPQESFSREADFFDETQSAWVVRIDVGLDAVQVHALQTELDECGQRLGHVAAAPERACEFGSRFGAASLGHESPEADIPYERIVAFAGDGPPDHRLRLERLFQELDQ